MCMLPSYGYIIPFPHLYIVCLLSVMMTFINVNAQTNKPFPTDQAEFVAAYTNVISNARGELASQVEPSFTTLWNSGKLTGEEKTAFISLANQMKLKNYSPSPSFANHALTMLSLVDETNYVKIPLKDYFEVVKQCIQELDQQRLNVFFNHLRDYVKDGITAKHRKFQWNASQENPQISFINLKDETEYAAPVIRFMETDLLYTSIRDTTFIEKTSGDFNLLSRNFIGDKGKVSWAKVGLDPEDVYCEFHRYKLNFNYGAVEADSVDFYYHSLINEPKPLVGRFVDENIGHESDKNAVFPFFKSYSGGVVIEELIPNVRYEGGFSLKGIRKIGSSFDILTEVTPRLSRYSGDPEREDFYSGYSSNEFYQDEDTDTNFDEDTSDEWGTSTSSYEDPFESEDSWALPDKVMKHIKAKLSIKRNDAYVMKLQSDEFLIDEKELVANNVESTVYVTEEDSLYHPSMFLKYTAEDQTAVLSRPKKGTAKSIPFTSSYHEYYMYFEAITWKLDTDGIIFSALVDKENKLSAIESFDYFTKARFDQFKNILKVNPIGAIYRFSLTQKDQPIFPEKILEEFDLISQLEAFKAALPGLEGSGFITYNKQTYEIYPQPKLYKWAKAARGKKDYDAIQVITKVDTGAYATLNIQTQDIRLRGVPYFSLSDSQYVQVVPMEGEVLVQENRNLLFAGAVASGKLNIYANDEDNRPRFTFDYENFQINCDSLDSIRFVLVRNPGSGYEPSPLERALSTTVFENVTGKLHIDDPGNKSGKEPHPEYPVFDSYSSSYLYWDKPHIQNGVYDKDKLYFSVDPFVLDSLENFDNQGITFDGNFFSSNIFPEFRQTLTVMPDFTLGFVQETPEEGYNVFDYKGKYYNEIYLDGSGLHGRGKLEHLDATISSDTFTFHFDSVMAVVDTFFLPASYRNPQVDATISNYVWYTKEDRILLASSPENPISIFDGEAEFDGKLFLSRDGLVGDGSITVGQVRISSDSIVFRDRDFEADASEFAIVDSIDRESIHFQAQNVDIDFDLSRRETRFKSREIGKPNGAFPLHNYLTTLTTGEYDMTSQELVIEKTSDSLANNYFISTNEPGDSIKFAANEAHYNVQTREIQIDNVPAIFIADALITPPNSELTVEETGTIRSFESATIEADAESRLHKIYDATVEIYSGSDYSGSGKYDYIEVNGKPQYILFEDILVNSDTITTATGEITEEQAFYLTDRILFRGTAQLDASEKFLTFEGDVRVESENPVFRDNWLPFKRTVVNPDSVFVPIPDNLENDFGEELTVGLYLIPQDNIFYSNFLQAKTDLEDKEILSAYGGLTLDRKSQEFIISTEEKIKGATYKGSSVAFNDETNIVSSSGFIDFPYKLNDKTVTIDLAGTWTDNVNEEAVSTDLLMSLNFDLIPEEPIEKVVENFRFLTTSNNDIDFLQKSFLSNVSEILDKNNNSDKETQKFEEIAKRAMVYTDIDLAERLGSTLLLSGVDFSYDEEEGVLYHNGELDLIGIQAKNINKKVNGLILYELGSASELEGTIPDILTIYLEVDEFNWIYFHIEGEIIKTFSTFYDDYNYPLQAEVDKRKKNEGPRFEMATEDEVDIFKQNLKSKYGNKE